MQQPPPRRGSGQQPAAFTFEAKLHDEEPLLDSVLAAMGRGVLPEGTWERLHAAAQRDERLSELAFSFESVSQGKRLKTAAPAVGAEFLFQAARFFGDVFGDELGAITYLERAQAILPTHAASFTKLEECLTKNGDRTKLAELYASAAQLRGRGDQVELLKRAANLLSTEAGAEERVIELLHQASRLDPADADVRGRLEALYLKTNRLRDVVRLQEQALAADPPPSDEIRKPLLESIVDLYADKLHEPERALPHVESLLALDPLHENARRVAQKLVVVKGLAARAAAALSQAFEVAGTPQDIARFLAIELESTRGPKRAVLLGRLGSLRTDRMGDDKGALEAFEQALAADATDDRARERYVAIATRLGRWADAAKTVGRVVVTVKDPSAKAHASAQLGELLLRAGDSKRAKTTLAGVLAAADAPAPAVLAAARVLREILQGEKDPKALADVLERLSILETEPEARRSTNEQLAQLATTLKDRARAVAAYERLLDTSARAMALAALVPLYEASGDPLKQARLLEEQAKDTEDATAARALMMRAIDVRTKDPQDAQDAIATCLAVINRFGAATDVLTILSPLLEGQRRWTELATALEQEASLVSGPAHAAIASRLGLLRLQRLRHVASAIEAFDEALAFDATDKTARATLEKLASHGDDRLQAARVLEPVYRRERATGPLLKLLELRGTAASDPEERMAALNEAIEIAEAAGAAESGRAVDLLGRALRESIDAGLALGPWLDRLARWSGTDPKRRAAALVTAIGEREVTSDELSALARAAAEALASSGDVARAIAMFRRALTHDPQSRELLARVDDLLKEQGSPAERVALYKVALAGASAERRRELLHRIGALEASDLGDPEAAIATFQAALVDDIDDAQANEALNGLYTRTGRWAELSDLLESRLQRVEGDAARSTRAAIAEMSAAHGAPERARTLCARLLEDSELSREQLEAVDRVAHALDDIDLERAVLHRRAEISTDAHEQITWLDRLGELDEQRRGDLDGAATAWKRAGQIAQEASDDDEARRLLHRARKVAPDDREVTTRLIDLTERAGLWAELPLLLGGLAATSSDDAERVELWLRASRVHTEHLADGAAAARAAGHAFEIAPTRADVLAVFESASIVAGTIEAFERAIEDVAGQLDERAQGPEERARLQLARARVLRADIPRSDEGARILRGILGDARVSAGLHAEALATYEALIDANPEAPRRRGDRRWLLEWRADHAPEAERVPRLLEWARAEEETFADHVHALVLYRRVIELDGDSTEALSAVTRLALATGDTDDALQALAARRDRAEGAARVAIELEIAQVLLARTTRWKDALEALRPVLQESPGDPLARGLAAQLLAHRATRSGALAILEQACDASDDSEVKVQILSRLVDAPADADDDAARRGWFERLTDQLRARGDVEGALTTTVRATREMPRVTALWDRAEEIARELKRPDEVAALYSEVLARDLEREEALAIGERAVQFFEEWFEDSTRVSSILERVLELDPTAEWAFDRLKLLLDSAERWDDLFAMYDRALEHAPKNKRTALLEEAAQTAKDFADRPDRAIQYLEQLHEARPGDAKLTSSLERLYERQGRHRELVSLLTARVPSLKHEDARRGRMRIAALWLDELGDPGQALDQIEAVIERPERAGDDGEVWSLLERILAASPQGAEGRRSTRPPPSDLAPPSKRRKSIAPASSKASVRQRAAHWLREHYAAVGREADVARMLLVELEAVRSAKDRVKRHIQIAEIHERLGDDASALEQLGAAFVLDPEDADRRGKLVALAERMARFERLADLLAAAADACGDGPLRLSLTMQAADVRADRLGDGAGAVALYASIVVARKASDDDVLRAARRLEPLLEAAGRDGERLDVLERIAALDPSADGRRRALGLAASLADRTGQGERAIACWEEVVSADPGDMPALDGLVDLLDRAGHHERLAEVLTLRSAAATSDDRRRADRVRRARLLGESLGRSAEAIEVWTGIERDFGEADDAALALAMLLRESGRWRELAELLERRARRTEDDGTRAELLRQLADVQRDALDVPRDAVVTYGRALEADGGNAGARAGLLTLSADPTTRRDAIQVLLAALRRVDDWHAILELTSHRLAVAETDDERVDVFSDASTLSEARAGDAGLAFEAIRQAFLLAPKSDRIWSETARLAESSGNWEGLVGAYREATNGAARGDAALIARLRMATGVVLETRRGDPEGALAEFVAVVDLLPSPPAADAVVRVAGGLGRWSAAAGAVARVAEVDAKSSTELLDAYERAAANRGDWAEAATEMASAIERSGLRGPAARQAEARVAVWFNDRVGDAVAAERAYVRALEHEPEAVDLLAPLAALRRARRDDGLVDTLLRLSRANGGELALLREAAEVAKDALRDEGRAVGILEDLLALAKERLGHEGDPGLSPTAAANEGYAVWAIEGLAELHGSAGRPDAKVDVLALGDTLALPRDVRLEMRRRAARTALDDAGRLDRGIALYLSLLEDLPNDAEAIARLSEVYRDHGRTADLLILRERQIQAGVDDDVRLQLRLEASTLLGSLGETVRAIEMLRANLQEAPRHAPTVEALAAILEAEHRTSDLRELLTDQARRAEDGSDRTRAADLWLQAAQLAEDKQRDPSGAEVLHGRVVALEPRMFSLDALARLATSRGDPGAAAVWLEQMATAAPLGEKVPVTLRLVDALVRAGDGAGAAARLEAALLEMPAEDALRERLATLYREREDWPRLAALVAASAAHAPDKNARLTRLLEAADLFEARCSKPEEAVPLLEQATDLAPEDAAVRLRHAGALAGARRFDEARAILQSMIDAFGGRRPKERAPVHYQVARLELAMGNRARALVELDTATRVDPQNPEILRTLAELARDDGQHERAEKSYRALLVVLRRREDSGDSRGIARSEVLLELSVIAERQNEGERAKEILESALEAGARSDFEQDRLESALRARGDDATLVRVLESRLARLGDSPAAAKTLAELADVLATRLDRANEALPVRLKAVALDPRSPAVHEAALGAARALGRVDAYLACARDLVEQAASRGDVALASSLLVRLGAIASQDLGNTAESARLYERAIQLGVRSSDVLRALDDVYEKLGDADNQARILAMRAEVDAETQGSAAAADSMYRLAALRLGLASTVAEGLELLQKAMRLEPQLGRVETVLAKALELSPAHEGLLDLYEEVGRQPGHERALVDALRLRASLPGADVSRVREAVDLALRIDDLPLAERLLEGFVEGERASSQNAGHLAWALDTLAGLKEKSGDLRRAVDLKRSAALVADATDARRLSFEVARLAAGQLGDLALAAEAYEALHEAEPADREAWEPLADVYRRLSSWQKLVDLFAQVTDYVDEPAERARIRLERVRVLTEHLSLHDDDALPLLRDIVDEDPRQVDAAWMLAAIYERTGAHDALADLLSRQLDAAKDREDAPTIASLALRLGGLLVATDRMQARNVYYAGLDWEPKSEALLDALTDLLSSEDDATERADLLERRLGLLQGPPAGTSALELAALRRDLGDEAGAERALELGHRGHPVASLRDPLERAFEERGDWKRLADLWVVDAQARGNVDERVAQLRRAAELRRERLGDTRGTLDALRLALESAPDDMGLLDEIVAASLASGDTDGAYELLTSSIARAEDDVTRGLLLARRAEARSQRGDDAGALEDAEAAFATDRGVHAPALIDRVTRERDRATHEGDTARERTLRLRLAQILPYAGQVDEARATLSELLRGDPKDRAALRTLASLETALERWDGASAALRRLVALEEEPQIVVETALRLADVSERAGRPGDARAVLERARKLAPQDVTVRERLQRVYEQTGSWHELAALSLDDARQSGDVAERFDALVHAGVVLLEQAGDPTAAMVPLEEARSLRPTDAAGIGPLADAYTLSGRPQDAVVLIEPVLALHKGKRAREVAPLYVRLARAARYAGDAAGELRALSLALDCDAQSGAVCADVALRALELENDEMANRALRSITLLKAPGPMSKALAYQYMGELAGKQGDPRRALMLLKRAVAEDASLDGARALIDSIERSL